VRTRATLSGIFASVAILVVGWQAGTAVVSSTTASTVPVSGGASAATTGTAAPASAAPGASAAPAAPVSHASVSGSFTGKSVDTPFGSVQVQIVVAAGKITDIKPLHLTDYGGRSVEISNQAVPMLHDEVLQSQSSQVSSIGGATYTSDGYLTSVQSAIDKAGL
jgi:uncharacterized protein with FMN-binding domain